MAKEQQLKTVVKVQDQASKELKKIKASFKSFANSAKELTSSAGQLGALTLAPFIGGLTAGAGIIKSSISAMIEYGSSVDDTSKSLGVASDSLQAFRYAAELGGSSAEGMDSAIAMLNKNIANAVQGKNKDLVALMNHLGISMKDANGHMKTAAQLMPEVADAIKVQKDSTSRATVAMAFFGKSGQDLIKTLADGSDGLANARKEAEHFGVILSQDAVDGTAQLGDSLTRTRYTMKGVQLAIGAQLLPLVQPMVDGFNEWVAANREWIATAITDAVKDFVKAVKEIDFKAILSGMVSFIKSSVDLFNKMGGLKTIGIALATIFGAKLAVSLVTTGMALFKFGSALVSLSSAVLPALITAVRSFGIALMTTPVGWIIAGIAAIATAGYLIVKNWDTVKAWLSSFWEWFKESPITSIVPFTGVVKIIANNWDSIKEAFIQGKDSLAEVWDWFMSLPELIKDAWSGLKDWFSSLFTGIGDSISSGITTMKDALPAWAKKTLEYGGKAIDLVSNTLSAPLPAVPLGASQSVNGAVEVNIHAPEGYQAEVAKESSKGITLNTTTNTGSLR